MLSQLLESAPPRRRRSPGWTLASAIAHTAIITGAVAATTRPTTVSAVTIVPREPIIFVDPAAPRDAASSPGPGIATPRAPETPPPISVEVPGIETTFDPSKPVTARQDAHDPFGPGLQTSATPYGGDHVAARGSVFTGASVDRIASALGSNPRPDYPQALRSSALEGDVLVTFVVDTTGRVAAGSITIVQATHDQFADAVRRWLPRTRYTPAEIRGTKVRQLVQQRIEFSIQR